MAKDGITLSEWQAELQRVLAPRNGEGVTLRELAEAWDVSTRTAGERIRALNRAGRLIVDWRQEPTVLPGRMNKSPVYRLKP